jgi:transposase-like protein
MSCFLGTPSLCPPPPCPFPSARRFSLAPSRPSDYLLPAPASFPAPAFSRNPPGIHPTHDRLLSSASALPRYSLSWHPPRPRPSRPFSSLLVPSCPVSSLLCILSRPEKGLQKRVNLMQQTTNSDLSRHYLPRQLRHLILQEYLSGVKTARQLSEEHGIPMSTIHKMGQRWKAKNSCSFVSTPNPYPIMSRVTSEEASELLSENKALRRRLEEALLRLEGYEIMGDILQEEYGIDLLKKSAAGQSSVSKKDTQQ